MYSLAATIRKFAQSMFAGEDLDGPILQQATWAVWDGDYALAERLLGDPIVVHYADSKSELKSYLMQRIEQGRKLA